MSVMENALLQDLSSGKIPYESFEAVPNKGNRIKVPNFHYVVYQRLEDNIWVGYCIDFDLLAYSKEKDKEKAEQKLFKRLCQMVINYIGTLIEQDAISSLYDESNWNFTEKTWSDVFTKKYHMKKIQVLESSLKRFMVEISSPDFEDSDDTLEMLYAEMQKHQDQINSIKHKITELLKDRGTNIVGFFSKPEERVA